MIRAALACLALLSGACAGNGMDGPATVARCTDCDIELRRVGTLSDAFDPGALPDVMTYATRDRQGRLYAIARKYDAVLIYAPDGSLAKRLGNAGNGPGEFGRIRRAFHGPGDSLYVADWGIGRLTVFAPDFTVARTQPLMLQPALVLNDGRFLVTADRSQVAVPMRLVGTDGKVIRSFEMDTSQFTPDQPLLAHRLAAMAKNGDVWTVAPGRYSLERWDVATAQRKQLINVESTWFKEVAKWPDDARQRPPAVIECLWEDDDGLVWVMLRDADVDWTVSPHANEERALEPGEYSRTYDWVLEAVDPATGAVIASKRFRDVFWARPPSNVLVSEREAEAGGSVFDVWQPVLVPRHK